MSEVGTPRTVLLDAPRGAALDVAAAGRALAPLLGCPRPDATRLVRYSAGLLLEAVPAERADAAVAALRAAGVAARAVDAPGLPDVAPPIKAARALPAEAGLDVAIGHDLRARLVPWDDVRAVHVFALEEPVPPPEPADPRKPKLPRMPVEARLAAELDVSRTPEVALLLEELERRRARERRRYRLGLDILVRGGAPAADPAPVPLSVFRCFRDGFSFEGWGPPEVVSSFERFMALGLGLAEQARSALVPEATRDFLIHGVLEPVVFGYEDELGRYLRWLAAAEAAR